MIRLSAMVLAVSGALLSSAFAAEPVQPRALSLADASRVIEAGKAEALRLHAGAVIAVVDPSGLLIAQERMDDPDMLASIDLAPGKARAAALFKKPSADLENAIDGGRIAAVTARGFVEMKGGLPLTRFGRVVGAVGVSTATPEHDEEIATAAAKAVQE